MNLLPALLIGGPPHSGKSVLAHSLSQELRACKVEHYLMRAAPDGEGDWSQEMDQSRLHAIRFKGEWTSRWVHLVSRDVAARVMPLLVDVGGKPTPEQMTIFDQCTGAILLTPDEDAADHWRRIVTARGLPILADLRSALEGSSVLVASDDGVLRGSLVGLHRGSRATGPVFQALVERVATILRYPEGCLLRVHAAGAPEDARFYDFEALARRLYPDDPAHRFQERDLAAILSAVPATPIAAYGRIPAWLATALGARCDLRWQFDVRLGWVRTPHFVMADAHQSLSQINRSNDWLAFQVSKPGHGRVQLNVSKVEYYLDYEAMDGLRVPYIPESAHVTINGPHTAKGALPLWVFAALGRAYRTCASVEARQAQQTRR